MEIDLQALAHGMTTDQFVAVEDRGDQESNTTASLAVLEGL
jgi:hypothetical protein